MVYQPSVRFRWVADMSAGGGDLQTQALSREARLWKKACEELQADIVCLTRERDAAIAQRDRAVEALEPFAGSIPNCPGRFLITEACRRVAL